MTNTSDRQFQTPEDLITYLASVMDDGGQGSEVWPPAKAAIAGIRAWQAGEDELHTLCDLCDLCSTRPEVRTDAEGISFCQECWDGWQAREQAVQAKKVQP